MKNNDFFIKLIPWAYLFLAVLSVRRYLFYNPFEVNGTVLALENIGIFLVVSVYPVSVLKLHKTIGKNKEYRIFNKFMVYTFGLCIYSLITNFFFGNIYEKMELFNYWIAVMSGVSVFFLSVPYNFTKATKTLYKILPFLAIVYLPWTIEIMIGDMVGFLLMPIILPLLFWKELSRYKKNTLWNIGNIYSCDKLFW